MNIPENEKIAALLVGIISDGFNRSLGALEEAGAVDTTRMKSRYKGVGSAYYDLVTEQIEYTAKYGAIALKQMLEEKA